MNAPSLGAASFCSPVSGWARGFGSGQCFRCCSLVVLYFKSWICWPLLGTASFCSPASCLARGCGSGSGRGQCRCWICWPLLGCMALLRSVALPRVWPGDLDLDVDNADVGYVGCCLALLRSVALPHVWPGDL